ncbi:MAG: hypothetical protein HQL53_08790 [Magnetococcales bacterium]|nr:hypothetical protein [Magnetococcales bacterium]
MINFMQNTSVFGVPNKHQTQSETKRALHDMQTRNGQTLETFHVPNTTQDRESRKLDRTRRRQDDPGGGEKQEEKKGFDEVAKKAGNKEGVSSSGGVSGLSDKAAMEPFLLEILMGNTDSVIRSDEPDHLLPEPIMPIPLPPPPLRKTPYQSAATSTPSGGGEVVELKTRFERSA